MRRACIRLHNGNHCLYYYDEQTPEAIAAAIQSVDLSDGYDGKAVLRRLDEKFLGDLKKLIFENRGDKP